MHRFAAAFVTLDQILGFILRGPNLATSRLGVLRDFLLDFAFNVGAVRLPRHLVALREFVHDINVGRSPQGDNLLKGDGPGVRPSLRLSTACGLNSGYGGRFHFGSNEVRPAERQKAARCGSCIDDDVHGRGERSETESFRHTDHE